MIGRKLDGSEAEVEYDRCPQRVKDAFGGLAAEELQAWVVGLFRGMGIRDAVTAKTLNCSTKTVQRISQKPRLDLKKVFEQRSTD